MKKKNNLAFFRKKQNLTQNEVAIMMGCTKACVSNWETGVSVPKLYDAIKLANLLKTDVERIFFNQNVQVTHTNIVVKQNEKIPQCIG